MSEAGLNTAEGLSSQGSTFQNERAHPVKKTNKQKETWGSGGWDDVTVVLSLFKHEMIKTQEDLLR